MITLELEKLYGNYIIVYMTDSQIGIDYATTKEELEELLMYHEKHTIDYKLVEIKKGE
jgi:hypothetical protein